MFEVDSFEWKTPATVHLTELFGECLKLIFSDINRILHKPK
jgi:hypothetical protein